MAKLYGEDLRAHVKKFGMITYDGMAQADRDMTVSNFLAIHRKLADCSLANYASVLGVSISYLSDLEHCRRSLGLSICVRFALRLGVPVEHFIQMILQERVDEAGLALVVSVRGVDR